jgi:PAS domain S-box-containing protein
MACDNNKEVAKMLVQRIGLHYAWHHVGMYRVDEAHGEFALVSEWHVTEASDVSALKGNYSGKMEGGLLKRAYEEGDQNVPPVEGHSELCMRIMADEKVIGLLNIKDSRDSAFLADEIKVLRDLLDVTGKVLERVQIANLIKATFEATMTAVLVIDGRGIISKANPSAASLLGYSIGEIEGSNVERFLLGGNHLQRLAERHNLAPEETILRHRSGYRVKVLLSGSWLGKDSSGMVISAQPIRELETELAA